MNFIFGVACIIFFIGLPILGVLFTIAVIKPTTFNGRFRKNYTRRKIVAIGLTSMIATLIVSFTAMALTVPPSSTTNNEHKTSTQAQQVKQKSEAPKPIAKTETATESIPFTTTEEQDGTLPNGQRQTAIAGVDGVRTHTFEVIYLNGAEQSRKETKNEVTTQPVTQVVKVGTYVAPIQAPVNSPAQPQVDASNGATAQCRDGTLSYSAHRRGTCSHHGGVAIWY